MIQEAERVKWFLEGIEQGHKEAEEAKQDAGTRTLSYNYSSLYAEESAAMDAALEGMLIEPPQPQLFHVGDGQFFAMAQVAAVWAHEDGSMSVYLADRKAPVLLPDEVTDRFMDLWEVV